MLTEIKRPDKQVTSFLKTKEMGVHPRYNQQLQAIMASHGFAILGTGSSASVWTNPKLPYVLKLFVDYDTGYQVWYKWMKLNQHNRYVPKIRGSLIKISDGIYAVRLERLVSLAKNGQYHGYGLEHLIDVYKRYGSLEQANPSLTSAFTGNFKTDPDLIEICKFFSPMDPLIFDFATDNNIMQRIGGQVVIVDPLV